MTIGNIDTKNVTAIFDKSNQDKKKIVSEACEYWVNQILDFGRQISNEMGNGIINVTDRDLLKFRKVFNGYILKHFPNKGNIMLWTSNGEYFESIGTDSYLENIMRIYSNYLFGSTNILTASSIPFVNLSYAFCVSSSGTISSTNFITSIFLFAINSIHFLNSSFV